MRILLIQPSSLVSERWANRAQPFLPIGLGFLAATLRENGHEVKLLDALTEGWDLRWRIDNNWIEIGLGEEDVAAEVRKFRPQVVGFSVPFTTQVPRLRSLARWVKAIHPEIYVVVGGGHATTSPREVLDIPEVDLVVLGEGEIVFTRVLERMALGRNFDNIDGIAYPDEEGGVVIRPPVRYISNLDNLPYPAYDLMPLKKYFKAVGKRCLPVFSSRGCEQKCSYCTTCEIHGNKVRMESPERLVGRIRHLVEYYGVREFYFDDYNTLSNKTFVHEFLDRLQSENIKIQWTARNGIDPKGLDDDILVKMRAAGGKHLHFSPESGSRNVLKRILTKSLDPFIVEQAVRRAVKQEFKVTCCFTLGSPGETLDEIYDTLNFAWKLKNLGVAAFEFSVAVPYHGTQLRKAAEKQGYSLPHDEALYTPHDGCISTPELSREQLLKIRDTAEREFNTNGLVLSLANRVTPRRRLPQMPEDRMFSTVAPQPVVYRRLSVAQDDQPLIEEAV